ncbi:type II secretion system F family protein [Clostridium tertium]|uniref:Type II secretion system protein F n=1 Tax=Clostridium tertium TaxID=1559 RepID=A0A6N3GVY3_9CLOT
MKSFKYRAMKGDGTKVEGRFEGESREEVINMITSNGYYPLKIEEIIESQKIEFNLFGKITTKDLAIFCRQFYTMLEAGVSIVSCLDILSAEISNKKLREVIIEVTEDVKKGDTLSGSMAKYPKVFPQILVKMVESGEVAGNIDEMMKRLSIHFEKEYKLNNKIKSSMIYPAVLSVVAVAAVIFIMTFVMPTFIQMFEGEGIELPLITKVLISVSKFMSSNWILLFIILIAIIIGFNIYRKTPAGYASLSRLKLSLPVLGKLNQKIIVSRYTRTLSTLLSAGVSLVHALPTVAGVVGNKVAEETIMRTREKVVRGDSLSSTIFEEKIFPTMLASMVKIGEESGALDDLLNKTADFYDDEVEQAIQTSTALIEPILIVFMGVTIGIIVISIMLPMFDLYTQI